MHVPDDAILDNSIKRFDHDTSVGALVEIHIFRKLEEDKSSLKGNRFRHMLLNVNTTQQLQHEAEESNGIPSENKKRRKVNLDK